MIRLIGIDIDGTLLDTHGRMPESNCTAIHDAVAAGIHVALVTGRSYPFARPVANRLPSSVSLIVSNGAVERAMDGSTFVRRLLDRDTARHVLDATRRHRHAAALVFDRDFDRQVVYETMDWEHPGRQRYWSRNHSHIAQSIPLEDALVEDPIQVMYNGGVDDMRALFDWLRAEVGGCAIQMTEYRAARLFPGRCHIVGSDEGTCARVARAAAGIEPRRSDGNRRQLQRCRDAGVRRSPGVDGQRRRQPQVARLARDRSSG